MQNLPPYTLIRSRRRKKTLSLQLRRDGAIVIQTPIHASQADINSFYEEKKPWLQKKIIRQKRQNEAQQPRTYKDGERFLYLGDPYPLRVISGEPSGQALTFTGREFILSDKGMRRARVLFNLWYQKQARDHFDDRVRYFGSRLGLYPAAVTLSNARCRWGSCSAENRLAFAWRLIMAPTEVIDYMVVHELGHMAVRNHSRDYWRLVEWILPGYRERRAWLKEHGHLLVF